MTGISRILALLGGVAVIALAAVLLTGGGKKGYEIKVDMPNAYGVRKNNSVKIAGVNGGKISDLRVDKRDHAILTLKLKEEARPVGKDATITVRPTDLLGERFIALDPGNINDELPAGSTIPSSRVSKPVELDNIINTFSPDVRTKMSLLINEFGIALGGRGTDMNKLLRQLPNNLDQARGLVKEVADENVQLGQIVTRGDSFLRKINTRKGDFGELITQADRALTMVSDNRENLGRTLQTAPAALTQLNGTLSSVRQASGSLGPAADSLRRTAAPLTATLKQLPGFNDSATDTLKAARSAAPAITRLANGITKPVKDLRPTAAAADGILTHSKATTDTIRDRADKDAIWFLQNFSRWFRPRDGLTHMVPANLLIDENYLFGAVDSFTNLNADPAGNGKNNGDGGVTRSKPAPQPQEAPKVEAPSVPTPQAPAATPKLSLPEIKLPKLGDIEKALKDLPKVLEKLPQTLTKGLEKTLDNAGNDVKSLTDGLDKRLKGLGKNNQQQQQPPQQQRQGGSDAMGLFDYLFAP